VLLDDLVSDRAVEPLPAPVIGIEPRPVEAPRGRTNARQRAAELESLAMHNLRAAEEARKVAGIEHQRLEAEASIRVKMEREAAGLRRELDRLRESEQLRVEQARYGAEREARTEVRSEIDALAADHERVQKEMERLRSALDDDRTLMQELTDRLREEQHAKAKLRIEADKAFESKRQLERSLELATEAGRRRAEDELSRLAAAEQTTREAIDERDRLAAELASLMSEDGRLQEMSQQVAKLEARVTEMRAERSTMAQQLDAVVAERDAAVADLARYENEMRRARTTAQGAAEEREMLRAGYTDLQEKHAEVLARVAELERALSDEQARGREADEELRRLHGAAAADARAVATGRAEADGVAAAPVDAVEEAEEVAEVAEVAAVAAVEDVPAADDVAPEPSAPEPDAATTESLAVDPLGRSVAMAELNAIAASTEGEDFVPRRR
jgi:DNA repair exonuclease SbcCD ATPase subunit